MVPAVRALRPSVSVGVLTSLAGTLAAAALAPAPAAAAPKDDRSRPLVYVFVLDGLDGDRVRQRRTFRSLFSTRCSTETGRAVDPL